MHTTAPVAAAAAAAADRSFGSPPIVVSGILRGRIDHGSPHTPSRSQVIRGANTQHNSNSSNNSNSNSNTTNNNTCVRGIPTHTPDSTRSLRTPQQVVGQKRPSSTSSTKKNMTIVNTSVVLFFLATGFSGLSQAAGAPSRSLRHNDKGDVDVPRLDFRQQFDSEDFVFDLQGAEPEVEGDAGTVKVANLGSVPVLSGEGVSYALVEIEPCGLNLPHHHPRAAEFGYIIKSESSTSVRHAFIEENSGRLIVNDIGEGQVALVPGGLVHFVQNMGCSPATFLAAFSSSDPGVLTTTTQGIAMLPEGTIQAALALGSDEAYAIIAGLPAGVVQGEKECLKRCGLDY